MVFLNADPAISGYAPIRSALHSNSCSRSGVNVKKMSVQYCTVANLTCSSESSVSLHGSSMALLIVSLPN
jgi:hypothetical protein